jgi:hypothetical protein
MIYVYNWIFWNGHLHIHVFIYLFIIIYAKTLLYNQLYKTEVAKSAKPQFLQKENVDSDQNIPNHSINLHYMFSLLKNNPPMIHFLQDSIYMKPCEYGMWILAKTKNTNGSFSDYSWTEKI